MGNWSHVMDRYMQRVPNKDKVKAGCMAGLARKIKDRKVPNGPWYRPVIADKETVCYVVGQGVHVSSILSADMAPKGIKI